jgi:EamA domain-containing membrane protein RarD
VFTVMLPLSAAAVGVVFLGESIGPGHAVAFVLAMVGLLLATWPSSGARPDAVAGRA